MSHAPQSSAMVGRTPGDMASTGHEPANLADILERVLDRGIVIVGDIRVSLLDIELLTIKLRLVIASVDTAREMGIDWWEYDPWLTSRPRRPIEADAAADEAHALEADAAAEEARERRLDREKHRA